MYPFNKKQHRISQVKISADHVIRCYKGRCLIESYDHKIAIWLDHQEVNHCGDYIDFTIDHDKAYFVSALNRLLRDNDYHMNGGRFTGQKLMSVFAPKQLDALEPQAHSLH